MTTLDLGKIKPLYKGDYSGATAYEQLDFVRYGGSMYVAKGATTGNLPTNTTYWDKVIDPAALAITGGSIDNAPIGATTPSSGAFTSLSATGNVTLGDASTDTLNVGNGGLVKDAAGQVGVGVTPSAWSGSFRAVQLPDSGVFGSVGPNLNAVSNATYNSGWRYINNGAAALYSHSGGVHCFYNAASGTAGNPITWNQAMRLDASGNLLVGATTGVCHTIKKAASVGSDILDIGSPTTRSVLIAAGDNDGYSYTQSVFYVGKISTSGRSINAGGTINANGADYAEYFRKSERWMEHRFAKGAVVGIDENGELTPLYADAVAFRVKSTDPCLVGGDVWGSEDKIGKRPVEPVKPQEQITEEDKGAVGRSINGPVINISGADYAEYEKAMVNYLADLASFEQRLEAARQAVERVMICGQTPVNVTGAKPGDWIVPAADDNGMIIGIAVSDDDITFAQHRKAVGQVIKIEADGRPRIIK